VDSVAGKVLGGHGSGAITGTWTTIQYDYLAAYLDFFNVDAQPVAAAVASAYADYPVPKWRRMFQEISTQLAEAVTGDRGDVGTAEEQEKEGMTREQRQWALGQTTATLDAEADEARWEVEVTSSNLTNVIARFYLMDVELLFSTSPFVVSDATSVGRFAAVRPNLVQRMSLSGDGGPVPVVTRLPLPEQFRRQNVMMEIEGTSVSGRAGPVTRRHCLAIFSHSMRVSVQEAYGMLRVSDADTGKPIARAYVKVYWSDHDLESIKAGTATEAQFYKDGYTDLRGAFDYTSLNTDELTRVKTFALLVVTEDHGAVIRTAASPKSC